MSGGIDINIEGYITLVDAVRHWVLYRISIPSIQMKPILLLGGGGHAKVVLDTLLSSDQQVIGFLDQNPAIKELFGVKRLGDADPSRMADFAPAEILLANGFGSTWMNSLRKDQFDLWKAHGYEFLTLIHPSSMISANVVLGEGVQVMAGAIVQAGSTIEANVLINTRAVVEHDCHLSSHVHVASGAILSGGVSAGTEAHIGPAVTVIQGVHIGHHSIVGAGSVVVRDVPEHMRAIGVPAHKNSTPRITSR